LDSAASDGGSYNMQLIVETEITCPHCGEVFPLQIDTSESDQSLIEDCSVCCRPINLTVHCQPGAVVDLAIASV
jgi:Cysteine-rich CPXCG